MFMKKGEVWGYVILPALCHNTAFNDLNYQHIPWNVTQVNYIDNTQFVPEEHQRASSPGVLRRHMASEVKRKTPRTSSSLPLKVTCLNV